MALLLLLAAALAPRSSPAQAKGAEGARQGLREAAPGLSGRGGIGLLGMPTADAGQPWQLAGGLWLRGFAQSDYLIVGDRNRQLGGAFMLDATLGRHVEVWLAVAALSNLNDRTGGLREDPPLLLSLGDTSLGVKLHGNLGGPLRLGLHPMVRISSSGGDIAADLSSTSAGVDLLASLDISRISPLVPAHLHVLIGYLQDRSPVLLEGKGCPEAGGLEECVYSRIVTSAAWGIRQPRVRLGLGAVALFQVHRLVLLAPILEYHLEAVTTSGDEIIRQGLTRLNQTRRVAIAEDQIEARLSQWITAGLRMHTGLRLTLDIGLLAGLSHPGYAMGTPLPQVAGYGALAFATDLRAPPPGGRPASTPSARAPEVPMEGRVRGVVRDRESGAPLGSAQVGFPGRDLNPLLSFEDGRFVTPPLPAGRTTLEASHPSHETGRAEVKVLAGKVVEKDILLSPKPPPPAMLHVDVLDEAQTALPATVTLAHAEKRLEVPPYIAGGFLLEVPEGTFTLRVESDGYLTREEQVVLEQGRKHQVTVQLRKRPGIPSVRLFTDAITLKSPVTFNAGTAELTAPSRALLDEVADLLHHHPELRRIRIEGHTDNMGKPQLNQQLSEERAIAVRSYLIRQGVAPERLMAEGLGATQPLVPNLSQQNRAKNRRVVFKIIERAEPPRE